MKFGHFKLYGMTVGGSEFATGPSPWVGLKLNQFVLDVSLTPKCGSNASTTFELSYS